MDINSQLKKFKELEKLLSSGKMNKKLSNPMKMFTKNNSEYSVSYSTIFHYPDGNIVESDEYNKFINIDEISIDELYNIKKVTLSNLKWEESELLMKLNIFLEENKIDEEVTDEE